MQEGDGAGVENRLHRTDVDAGIGTDRPSIGFDSAARWISTGLGWSTAPAVNRHKSAARAAALSSPTTANSSARLPRVVGSRPAA